MRFAVKEFFSTSRLKQERRKISTDELLTRRGNFLRFLNQAPHLSFKKLIVTSPMLLRGLHQMSMLKTVPKGLKLQECEQIKLRKLPPVPYVPRKQRILYDELRTRATFTCPKPRTPFFGSQVVGFTSNPSCLKYWLLHFLFYEEAMCKGSIGNGLLYAAKAVP